METQLLNFGVTDMSIASIMYALEFYQWNDFLYEWKDAIYTSFGHIFLGKRF